MAIEDTLIEIRDIQKAILVALQSGNTAVAALGEPEKAKTTRTKKTTDAAAAETAGEGAAETRFYISKDGTGHYKVEPGQTPPTGANAVSEALWLASKDEYEKKSSGAATQPSAAGTAPSATAPAATASGAVTFKEVVDRLTVLSKDTAPGRGREGVMAILNQFLGEGAPEEQRLAPADRKVPKLEALGKNDVILAAVNAALSDAPAADAVDNDDPFA